MRPEVTHHDPEIAERAWLTHLRSVTVAMLLALCLPTETVAAQDSRLGRDHFKNGDRTLRAFASICMPLRDSIVKLDADGSTVALAAVIDENGMAVTKASEIRQGKLTGWTAGGTEVSAELISIDEESDLALVKLDAKGLRPIPWTTDEIFVGQWVVTPGNAELPQAIGIVSVPTRKIPPPRALIGVQLDQTSSAAKIERILPGLGAEQAGLKSGDLILAVNGTPTKAGETLINRLRDFREGQIVKLRVQRDDQEFECAVAMMVPKPESGRRGWDRADFMDRMGTEPSRRAEGFALAIQHDTTLEAWQCGGPLVNLEGKAIGLNIARAGRVASYALPADLVQQVIQRLKAQAASERFRGKLKTSQRVETPAQ